MAVQIGPEAAVYTSKIIKAGALLPDTRAFFAVWDPSLSPAENLTRIRTQNLLGKSSRSRVEDILAIFRQRYLGDPESANALAILVQGGLPAQILDRIFYFYATQSDRLLRDLVIDVLAPRQWMGQAELTTDEVQSFVCDLVLKGKTAGAWSEPTARWIAQGLLATLRDFGLLTGAAKKRLTPVYLPVEAFAYLAFILNRRVRSADQVLRSPEWQIFYLQSDLVERFLIEADQERLLRYSAAGRVVRLDFPADSLEDYARTLTQRPH